MPFINFGFFTKLIPDTNTRFVRHYTARELRDKESSMHCDLRHLVMKLTTTYDTHRAELKAPVAWAAQNLINELTELLAQDSATHSKVRADQYRLAHCALQCISKYRAPLEAEPGFWNQCKAHINHFFETYLGFSDVLPLKITPFAAKTAEFIWDEPLVSPIQEFKLRFNAERATDKENKMRPF